MDEPVLTRLTKTIWTIGFLIGFITHALDLWNYGWLPYDFRPLVWNIYWTSLTFLDPLAAGLIWVRARAAIILGTAIMASNISINGFTNLIGYEEFFYPLIIQSVFAGFVFLTASRHWTPQMSISSPR